MMRFDFGDYVTLLIVFSVALFGVGFFFFSGGEITIEHNYLGELKECQENLDYQIELKTPICPECKCSTSLGAISLSIILIILASVGWYLYFKLLEKHKKKKKK